MKPTRKVLTFSGSRAQQVTDSINEAFDKQSHAYTNADLLGGLMLALQQGIVGTFELPDDRADIAATELWEWLARSIKDSDYRIIEQP